MFSLDECMLEGIKSVRLCRPAPHLPATNASVSLETVASYVLELEVEVGDRRYSSITLREVPSFLLEAFRDLRSRGMDVEGLFRKEGNWNRLKNTFPVYFGCIGIPGECTVHDICSMIKRFFRELKTPLFAHLETKLIDIASISQGEVRRRRLLDAVLMLPPSHLGTLAYLLRQLKYFGDHHEGHHMTIENLSRVFAPTLFREGNLHIGNKKKKKNIQKPLYTVMRDETELKITIIMELIENAGKVGVPHDCYIFSRRPSDLNFNKNQVRRAGLQNSASLRSSSAKPFTRNSFPRPSGFIYGDGKEKKGEKLKYKNREGRRSSSTVRDIFSSISSISTKVLRRAASPSRILSRRTSVDVIANETASLVEEVNQYPDEAKGTNRTTGVSVEKKNVVTFDNEEEEQSKTITFDNEEEQPRGNIFNDASEIKSVLASVTDGAHNFAVSQRRSRRESPRKHLTVNSRVKPFGDPMIGVDWWPASPAFEPPQISVKHLSEVVQTRKSLINTNEKDLEDNKSVGQRPRTNKEALDANHIALSFLEGCEKDPIGNDRRRRHTTPLKFTSILKRNQPNTIATGLKSIQIHVRDRRAFTLSFRSSNEVPSRRFDKMKRRSESLGGDSSDRSQISDEENSAFNSAQFNDANALLEQKNNECRQRRAKRKKRKEKTSDSAEEQLFSKISAPRESSPVSLLDDVTNALERLERERQPKFERNPNCVELIDAQASTSIKSPNVPCLQRTHSGTMVSPIEKVKELQGITSMSKFSPSWSSKSSLLQSLGGDLVYEASGTFNKGLEGSDAGKYENAFKMPTYRQGKSAIQGQRLRSAVLSTNEEINDEAFAFSDLYKKQILTRKKEDSNIIKQCCGSARPSVAFIKNNNRGMVKQRVNQFAQLESQNLMESFSSRSSQNSIYAPGLYEFMKPSAPPVTHGLRPAERRLTTSPPSTCSTLSRTKLSDISPSNSSPQLSPQRSLKFCSPVFRVTSKPTQGSSFSSIGSTFTPLSKRRMKQ